MNEIESIENLLINEEEESKKKGEDRVSIGERRDGYDDNDHGLAGDFEIPCSAQTNEPFMTENCAEFTQSQKIDHPIGDLQEPHSDISEIVYFDGENLVEAPLQVNVLNIQYAKTSKSIDVRRLKQTIWKLIDTNVDKVR